MSSTQLLVLGVVRMSQPVHGYDVGRALLQSLRNPAWVIVSLVQPVLLETSAASYGLALGLPAVVALSVAAGTFDFLRSEVLISLSVTARGRNVAAYGGATERNFSGRSCAQWHLRSRSTHLLQRLVGLMGPAPKTTNLSRGRGGQG